MDVPSDIESSNYIPVPMEIFSRAITGDDVNIRVYFSGGRYADGDFDQAKGRGGALTAKHYLSKKFWPEVIRIVQL